MADEENVAVGVLRLKMVVRDARSLKDKRRAVKKIKDRVRNKFNASIAEVGAQEWRQSIDLGVAVIGNDRRHLNSVLSSVVNLARSVPPAELVDYSVEFF